jgi:hypothetical protein
MSGLSTKHAQARRLEEMALNASGAFQSLLYDGWLLGSRAGPTKRIAYDYWYRAREGEQH